MLTLFKIEVSTGPQAEAVLFSWGRGSGNVEPYTKGKLAAPELTIPWRPEPQDDPTVGQLLDWRSALSAFTGRDDEIDDLRKWCDDAPNPSFKFVVGDGGVGKTRLAAEFADGLRKEGWAAGFLDLRNVDGFSVVRGSATGNLIIVDYPESNADAVEELFADLAALEPSDTPIRVLLLSREGSDVWLDRIERTGARTSFSPNSLGLRPLTGAAPFQVFQTAIGRAAKLLNSHPIPLPEGAFEGWLDLAPENPRSLFIVALAVYAAIHPRDVVVTYSGREVVVALANREIGRFERISRGLGLPAHALPRLLAIATVADGVGVAQLKAFAERSDELEFGVPGPNEIVDRLNSIGFLTQGAVPAITPDILATALVVEVFRHRNDLAPEWLWAAIEDNVPRRLETLGRLIHDAEIVLGLGARNLGEVARGEGDDTLSAWIRDAFSGNSDRCLLAREYVADSHLPLGLVPLEVAVWRTLSDAVEDEAGRAGLLNDLSVGLLKIAANAESLDAVREAVDIYRGLAATSPARYEPDLALSLNSLSISLSEVGDTAAALGATHEAVEIRRRLAAESPARHEADLAKSLNTLSNRLSAVGNAPAALDAMREALDINRRLAAASPARYELYLAMSLNNLSLRLSAVGDTPAALGGIREAVDIYRRLAAASPARYETELAESLNSLSNRLSAVGDAPAALEAIREAVDIYRRHAPASPARYEPALALSLNNLSVQLSAVGEAPAALEAIREAMDIYRRLPAVSLARYEPDLARSLNNLSAFLSTVGDAPAALDAVREAVEVRRRLAAANPARYEPDLALSLNNLSICLGKVGDTPGALNAIREAVEIRHRMAAASPARYEPDLANSLLVLSDRLEEAGQIELAIDATEEALHLMRPFAERYPDSEHERRYRKMQEDLARLTDGDNHGGSDKPK